MARKTTRKSNDFLNQEQPPKPRVPLFSWFMAAVLVYYERDGLLKQRHLNLLAQLPAASSVTKAYLESLNVKAIQRMHTENSVPMEDVKDVVFQNISFLGVMSEADFHGTDQTVVDRPEAMPA